jgi:septum site-determining protein MinC
MGHNKVINPVNLSIKGKGDNLVITSHHQTFIELWNDFSIYVKENETFLHNAKIALDVREIEVHSNEMFKLRDFIQDHHMSIVQIKSTSAMTNQSAGLLGIPLVAAEKPGNGEIKLSSKSSDRAVILRKTIRSGTVIDEVWNVIIIGDVNPGAVIRSDGNVLVWGKLQGEVHAGRSGDAKAIICALELNPTTIKIAGNIWVAARHSNKEPEIAYVEENSVKIVNWNKKAF